MKWVLPLSVAAGLAAAVAAGPEAGQALKRTLRPHKSFDAVSTQDIHHFPRVAAGFHTEIATPSIVRDTANLQPVPGALVASHSPGTSRAAPRAVRRQPTAQDFYECSSSTPVPKPSDCTTVTDSVLATPQDLVVGAGSCLVFTYATCMGFFCALCDDAVTTSTTFVGRQLDTVEALCVEGGRAGTIVGEGVPQWEAGFVHAGAGLPTYNDVC